MSSDQAHKTRSSARRKVALAYLAPALSCAKFESNTFAHARSRHHITKHRSPSTFILPIHSHDNLNRLHMSYRPCKADYGSIDARRRVESSRVYAKKELEISNAKKGPEVRSVFLLLSTSELSVDPLCFLAATLLLLLLLLSSHVHSLSCLRARK